MTYRNEVLTASLPQVEKSARSVASKWPGVCDAGDLVQEISLRVLKEWSDEQVSRLEESSIGEQRSLFRQMANQIAHEYRSAYEMFTGNYRYDADEVRQLLNSGCLIFADLLTLSERMDITFAMEEISGHYHEILVSRFVEEVEGVDTKEVSRAIRALTELMNRNYRSLSADYFTRRPVKGSSDVDHF